MTGKPQTAIFGHVNKRDKEGFHELVKNHRSDCVQSYNLANLKERKPHDSSSADSGGRRQRTGR
jgi:hypothetical protein